jgi:hypothetical protein
MVQIGYHQQVTWIDRRPKTGHLASQTFNKRGDILSIHDGRLASQDNQLGAASSIG